MSFIQPSSSLQRAVQQGRRGHNEKGSSPQQRRSSFESCFATGLDLSEFGDSNSRTSVSNAATLLQIKQQEAAVKQQQEYEETRLQQAVKQRIQAFQQEQTKNNNKQKLYHALEVSQRRVRTEPSKQTSLQRASKPTARKTSNATASSDFVGALVGMMHQNDETTPRTNRRHRSKSKSATNLKQRYCQSKNKARPVKKAQKHKH